MPVLRSESLEKAWGKPDVSVKRDGTYQLRYRQGTTLNFVMVRSLVRMEPTPAHPPDWEEAYSDPEGIRPAPAPHHQSWKLARILGQSVKWYQNDGGSGADFPSYKTVDFPLTAPDGRKGIYQVEICTDSPAKASGWLQRLSW